MVILIFEQNGIVKFRLPGINEENFLCNFKPYGSKNFVSFNVAQIDKKWYIHNNDSVYLLNLVNQTRTESTLLENYNSYVLHIGQNNLNLLLVCVPFEEKNCDCYDITKTTEIIIGKTTEASIIYNNPIITDKTLLIKKEENKWLMTPQNDINYNVYLNDKTIKKAALKLGDVIRIGAFKLIWMENFIVVNNPNNEITIKNLEKTAGIPTQNNSTYINEKDEEKKESIYNPADIYYHKPRLKTIIEHEEIQIDAPPENQIQTSMPFLLTIGTRITMLVFAGVNVYNAVNNYQKTGSWASSIPSLLIAFSSVIASLVFPIIIQKYQKKLQFKNEAIRQKKYSNYLEQKNHKIQLTLQKQSQIVTENNPTVTECQNIILNSRNSLWLREKNDNDFLSVRLGLGKIPASLEVKAPEEHFVLFEDNLFVKACEIAESSKELSNVPVSFSFAENFISALVMDGDYNFNYINGIIMQLLTHQSSLDLKIVVLTDPENTKNFAYLKNLPHCWSDDYKERYYADNVDEIKKVCSYIEPIFKKRKDETKDNSGDNDTKDESKNRKRKKYQPHYLIITNNIKLCRGIKFINENFDNPINYGFSYLMLSTQIQSLTNDFDKFIYITKNSGCILSKELAGTKQVAFIPDESPMLILDEIGTKLCNIPIEMNKGMSVLPNSISFLEMLDVGKIEQINVMQKWMDSNPMSNLAVPIGVYPNGDLFKLDLHEKAHGPHGLIAGTTGSGKSEFIITFILSMSLFYHPYEVQFVLIDYKGGGLAGVFENRENNFRLPHLVGTITNLDINEMNRTLVSIESELKRRQTTFNKVRDIIGESTIDIYKYQKYYREGVVKEPIAHLFIICDEFAELKTQQPDFMDKLISTARIGRSLGVHLILATQKPSGVVNDQIWSNSKFRVCLKVQNRSDSMEVLKRDDAAYLREAGRFYLQVGNDELFEIGQSAWSGAKYIPSETVKKKENDSLDFVDNTGQIIKSINNISKTEESENLGDQLTNLVKYLIGLAKKQNIETKKMWLDSIPKEIYYNNLIAKYNYKVSKYNLDILIGEYDNPSGQEQGPVTINLSNSGNMILYGATGSGKEHLITTLIVSSIINHSPNEINFYLIDLGAETLKIFEKTPHVGEVIVDGDVEKMEKLLEYLYAEIERRKELFKDYFGSFSNYNMNSEQKAPLILVIINNFEMLLENFSKISDSFTPLFRDGIKYGIKFLITSTAVSRISFRLGQLFSDKIMLNIEEQTEYRFTMKAPRGLVPSNCLGRGLININNAAYEFQTAYISELSKISNTIKTINKRLLETYSYTAHRLKILPKKVYMDSIIAADMTYQHFPIGLKKDDAEVLYYDFEKNKITPIIANYIEEEFQFILSIIKEMNRIPNTKIRIIDALDICNEMEDIPIYKDNLDTVIQQIDIELDRDQTTNRTTIFVFVGIGLLKKKISVDYHEFIDTIFKKIKTCEKNIFILTDNYINYKNIDNETYYYNIDKTSGIWLGEGVNSQFSFNAKNLNDIARQRSFNNIAYLINKGSATAFKYVIDREGEDGK